MALTIQWSVKQHTMALRLMMGEEEEHKKDYPKGLSEFYGEFYLTFVGCFATPPHPIQSYSFKQVEGTKEGTLFPCRAEEGKYSIRYDLEEKKRISKMAFVK